jgi:hypothetical protein
MGAGKDGGKSGICSYTITVKISKPERNIANSNLANKHTTHNSRPNRKNILKQIKH